MKTGAIDPHLKSQIDGLQFIINKYLDGISYCLIAGEGLESNAVYFFRRRIKSLVLQKWELTQLI